MAIKPFDVFAILDGCPAKGLVPGQADTVVETLAPNVFEVKFSDDYRSTYANVSLKADRLLRLHHDLAHAA